MLVRTYFAPEVLETHQSDPFDGSRDAEDMRLFVICGLLLVKVRNSWSMLVQDISLPSFYTELPNVAHSLSVAHPVQVCIIVPKRKKC